MNIEDEEENLIYAVKLKQKKKKMCHRNSGEQKFAAIAVAKKEFLWFDRGSEVFRLMSTMRRVFELLSSVQKPGFLGLFSAQKYLGCCQLWGKFSSCYCRFNSAPLFYEKNLTEVFNSLRTLTEVFNLLRLLTEV